MKKKLSIILIATMLASVILGGCSKTEEKPELTSPAEIAEAGEPENVTLAGDPDKGEIEVWSWEEYMNEPIAKVVEEFNKQSPDIKVNLTQIPFSQYWTKLQTALPAGAGPDLYFFVSTYLPYYTSNNMIMDLTDLAYSENGIALDKHSPTAVEKFTYKDRVWGVPLFMDDAVLAYNKRIFDEGGVAYPEGGWTWEQLLDAAQKLTTDDNWGFIAAGSGYPGCTQFVYQAGGHDYIDGMPAVNTDAWKRAIQFNVDLMYKYKVSPTAVQQQETDNYQLFASGKVAMAHMGSWCVSGLVESLGDDVAFCETTQDKEWLTLCNTCAWAMNPESKNPAAAYSFLQFLGGEFTAKAISEKAIPSYMGMGQAWADAFPGVNAEACLQSIDNGHTMNIETLDLINSTEIGQILTDELSNIWFQSKTVEEGLNDAQEAMTKAVMEALEGENE